MFTLVALYLVAATALWIVADQSAPAGSRVSYKRVLCAVALMIPLSFVIGSLRSLGVYWGALIEFSLDFFVVLILIRMSFWRSLFAAATYFGTIVLAGIGLEILFRH